MALNKLIAISRIDYSRKMFLIRNGHAAVWLLALTYSLVIASSDNAKNETEVLAKRIINYLRVPWMDGHHWILHSTETSRVREVQALIRGIESHELWAQNVLDAMLRIQREIPTRNVETYDQYIETNTQNDHINIQGNTCPSVSAASVISSSGSNGSSSSVCDPLSIVKSRFTQIVSDTVKGQPVSSGLDRGARGSSFERVESKDFTKDEILAIAFFSTVGAFMIACTICDIVRRISGPRKLSTTLNTLSQFSIYTNAIAILSIKRESQLMSALHGIRCLSFYMVFIGHYYAMKALLRREKITLLEGLEWENSWAAFFVMSMTIPFVDTFFVISGFLVTYLFLKAMQSGMKPSFLRIYLYRYIRLTPCLGALILFVAVLAHRTGDGHIWETSHNSTFETCQKNWWVNLLYLQNLVRKDAMCLLHSWYLAAEMQLFWIAPMILYPLHRYPKFGLRILSVLLVVSVITPVIRVTVNDYFMGMMRLDTDWPKILSNFNNHYVATYNHACAYFIGVLLGYDAATRKRRLTPVNVAINWVFTAILFIFSIWAYNCSHQSNFAYDLKMEIALTALARPSWSIATAWVIYACTQGYGGVVTRFLSIPLFQPLSRLSYCNYLVHLVIQGINLTPSDTTVTFLSYPIFNGICGNLVLSTTIAFILSLFFESPIFVLKNILTDRSHHPKQLATPLEKPGMEEEKNETNLGSDFSERPESSSSNHN